MAYHQNKTLPRGVYVSPNGKRFIAKSSKKGKPIYLGTYDTIQESEEAYLTYMKNHPELKPGPTTKFLENSAYDNLRTAWYNL